jgi:hypothetical protein
MAAFGAGDISGLFGPFLGAAVDKFYFFEFVRIEPETFALRTHIDDHHGLRITEGIKRPAAPGTIKRLLAGLGGDF